LDPERCQCLCPGSIQCPAGEVLDCGSCSCRPGPVCPTPCPPDFTCRASFPPPAGVCCELFIDELNCAPDGTRVDIRAAYCPGGSGGGSISFITCSEAKTCSSSSDCPCGSACFASDCCGRSVCVFTPT
jgi:hypothetical protein